ncbi:hypothetical protein AB0H37_24680 [Actinomadura sp. NPDC023710]|uniref:hypothetical protein n=1 Tax=Actinomadura sp. NPDC023710 TaxID=3158219 RepID=UPI0033BFCCB9
MNHPPELVDQVAARIRDLVRIHPGPNATAALTAGRPIILSGREAEVAAIAGLDVLGPKLDEERQRADTAEQVAGELEAEGVERMADRFMEQTKIRSMEIRGGMDLDLEPSRELVALWVGAARGMLGDAPNYTETLFEVPTDDDPKVSMEVKLAGEVDRYAFVLQRVGKVTPHQARMQAEERADRAEEEAAQLREEISRLRAQRGENA